MKKFRLHLLHWLLIQALKRKSPDRIPCSGAAGEKANFFSVYINRNQTSEPYLLVRALSGDSLECLRWTGQSFDEPCGISISEVQQTDLEVTHFYGLDEVIYKGLADWAWGRITLWPYAKIWAVRVINSMVS